MTARKHWFRAADSLLRENWDDAMLATWVRLLAFLNSRWARDGIATQNAGWVILRPRDIAFITNRARAAHGEPILRRLAADGALTMRQPGAGDSWTPSKGGGDLTITVPNYAKFQGLSSRSGAIQGPSRPPPHTPPQDAPAPAPAVEPEGPKRQRAGRVPTTKAPSPVEFLGSEKGIAFAAWVQEHTPQHMSLISTHLESCFDHFRAQGTRRADWAATARNWFKRIESFGGGGRGGSEDGALSPRQQSLARTKAERQDGAAQIARLVLGEEKGEEFIDGLSENQPGGSGPEVRDPPRDVQDVRPRRRR